MNVLSKRTYIYPTINQFNQPVVVYVSPYSAWAACGRIRIAIQCLGCLWSYTYRHTLTTYIINRFNIFQINGMLSMTFFVASISTLCCISVDRYYAVVKPVKYKNIFTIRKATTMLVSSWTIAVLCASLPVFGWTEYVYHPGSNHCSPDWKRHCGYYFFMTLIGFGIPLVILLLTYWMIFAAIRKHERRFSTWSGIAPRTSYRLPLPCADPGRPIITVHAVTTDSVSHADASEVAVVSDFRRRSRSICSGTVSPNSQRRNTAQVDFLRIPGQSEIKRQSSMLQFRALAQITTRLRFRTLTIPREYRIAKTGLMLFFVFFVSWGPYMVVNNCNSSYETPVWLYRLAIWLVYSSCILNPMVYAFSSKHIRDAFRVALKCRRERRIADAFHMRKMSEATSTNHVT
jgi:hypothetical protein